MKNILLLTDFSQNATNAIHYALNLFKAHKCTFVILHVKDTVSYATDDLMLRGNDSIYDSVVKNVKIQLDNLIIELTETFDTKNFQFEAIVDYDIFTDSINQVVRKKEIDVVVMGTNGVTGAKEVLFGSNTINVLRKVDCTTLIIPEGYKYKQPKELLLPLDLFDSISGKAFMGILEFMRRFSESLHLLRIKPNNEDSNEEKKDQEHINYFLKETSYKYHSIANVPLKYVVSCYSQTHNIDLIALLVQKESLFERFFIGSPTTKISNETLLPLLVFHS
jgi:nucleotide-binding universal stress UspA family protein